MLTATLCLFLFISYTTSGKDLHDDAVGCCLPLAIIADMAILWLLLAYGVIA